MADVAHEQQAAALQGHVAAVGRGPAPVGLQRAGQCLAALLEGGGQVAAHQAQPVAIGLGLVSGVHSRNRVFQIDNGGQGGFQHDVGQPRRITAAHWMGRVDHQFDMQAVVRQQDGGRRGRVSGETDELGRILQGGNQGAVDHRPAGDIGVRPLAQGRRLIQKRLGAGHDPGAARRVIAAAGRQVAQSIRAVEGVVQAAPPGVGGVQQKAGVQHRHDQLRPGHAGDLGVYAARADGKGRRILDQITDLAQEGLGRGDVIGLAPAGGVPGVDPGLKIVAPGQQGAVLRCEPGEDLRRAGPEVRRVQSQARQYVLFDQGRELGRDLQSGAIFIGRHGGLSPARRRTCNNA